VGVFFAHSSPVFIPAGKKMPSIAGQGAIGLAMPDELFGVGFAMGGGPVGWLP